MLQHDKGNRYCVDNGNDGQLSKNGFHWENVTHPSIGPALIHDTETAVQEPVCAKTVLEEKMYLKEFSTWWIFLIYLQHRHERAVVALNFRVYAGTKNSTIGHSLNAQDENPCRHQVGAPQVLVVPPPVFLVWKRIREYTLKAWFLLWPN